MGVIKVGTWAIRIFDGEYTSVYTTEALTADDAIYTVTRRHTLLGGKVVKVTATKVR